MSPSRIETMTMKNGDSTIKKLAYLIWIFYDHNFTTITTTMVGMICGI